MQRKHYLIARLRPGEDDDLIRQLDRIPPGRLSECIRDGLRLLLRLHGEGRPCQPSSRLLKIEERGH